MNKSTILTILGGLLLVALLGCRIFLYEMFKIPASSMIPTLQVGDHMGVNKYVYWRHAPARGDVMVFKYPKEPDKDFVKRVIAVGGDTIEIRDNQLILNGQPVPRRHLEEDCRYQAVHEDTGTWEQILCDAWEETLGDHTFATVYDRNEKPRSWAAQTVPQGAFYVLGDNRDNSHDSRFWGFVPLDLVKGRVELIVYSFGPNGNRGERTFMKIR